METAVLEIARQALQARLDPPPRIVAAGIFGPTGCSLILEPEDGTRWQLVLDVDPDRATLHAVAGPDLRGPTNLGGFGARLAGGYLMAQERGHESRVLRLRIRKPTEPEQAERDTSLIAEWTGRSGNLRIVNAAGVLREVLLPAGPAAGEPYAPPPSDPRPGIDQIDPGELARTLGALEPRRWVSHLARLPEVSRPMVWETILGFEETDDPPRDPGAWLSSGQDPIQTLTERATDPQFDLVSFTRAVLERLSRLTQRDDPSPRLHLYRIPASLSSILPPAVVAAHPWPTLSAFRVENAPADPMALLAKSYAILAGTHREQTRRSHYEKRFRLEMRRLQKLRGKVAAEAGTAEDAKILRRSGEAILNNLRRINKGDSILICEDWTGGTDSPRLEIPLDPARPATDVANDYFKRARRSAKARPIREKRILKLDEAMAKLSMLESRMRDQEALPDASTIESGMRDALRSFYKEPPERDPAARLGPEISHGPGSAGRESQRGPSSTVARGRRGGGSASGGVAAGPGDAMARPPRSGRPGESRFRPREFTVRDGWTVIVGRSNEENDYVTHRLAKQDDYWFHASGVPGSHVVLKRAGRKDNPSTRVLEEAAAIAAFYSKSRNSRKAPVICTLKKYVRKPRKGKPGLALCSNEKTLMVVPTNPEEGLTPDWIDDD